MNDNKSFFISVHTGETKPTKNMDKTKLVRYAQAVLEEHDSRFAGTVYHSM
jgi:hypothetical protein